MRPYFLSSYVQRLLRLGLLSALVILFFAAALPAAAQVDPNPPVLAGFDFSPKQIDTSSASASVTATLHVTDDLSGFNWGAIAFYSPSGTHSVTTGFSGSGDPRDETSQAVLTFPAFSEPGNWTVASIYLWDAVGNYVYYGQADLQNLGFPTSLTNGPPSRAPAFL